MQQQSSSVVQALRNCPSSSHSDQTSLVFLPFLMTAEAVVDVLIQSNRLSTTRKTKHHVYLPLVGLSPSIQKGTHSHSMWLRLQSVATVHHANISRHAASENMWSSRPLPRTDHHQSISRVSLYAGCQGSRQGAAPVWPPRDRQDTDWQSHCQQHQGHLLQHQCILPHQQVDRPRREDGAGAVCSGRLHAASCHLCG